MDRRRYLRLLTTTTGITASAAGCLGSGNPDTTLSEPDHDVDSEDLSYPAWGERVPDVTLSAPISGRDIAVRDIGTPSILTFFFSHCRTMCPALINALRTVQTHSTNNNYADEVTFLPITFDPARDDAARLRAYSAQMNIDLGAGNWHFLRPESEHRATAAVNEAFGVPFKKDPMEDGDGYMFTHPGIILLVNESGYVERSYRGNSPDHSAIIEALESIR